MARIDVWVAPAIAAMLTGLSALGAQAAECRMQSAPHRVTVLELYTSEGCNSCPPVDRWFSALQRQGVTPEMAIPLAFHVDYWNQLGWPDRFSRPGFSQRQREVARRASAGVVYTPQLVLDGKDLRQRYDAEQLRTKVDTINRERGQARIEARLGRSADALNVSGEVEVLSEVRQSEARAWIALFENGLSTRVKAGENAGRLLLHDYVVRELAGPFAIGSDGRAQLAHKMSLNSDWKIENVGVAIFVERTDTGKILEATALYPLCPS